MSLDPRQQTGLQQMQTMHDASLSGLRAEFFLLGVDNSTALFRVHFFL